MFEPYRKLAPYGHQIPEFWNSFWDAHIKPDPGMCQWGSVPTGECPSSKEPGHSPSETLPVLKHAEIASNLTVPKDNAKSQRGCPLAGLDFNTMQGRILDMRDYRPQKGWGVRSH